MTSQEQRVRPGPHTLDRFNQGVRTANGEILGGIGSFPVVVGMENVGVKVRHGQMTHCVAWFRETELQKMLHLIPKQQAKFVKRVLKFFQLNTPNGPNRYIHPHSLTPPHSLPPPHYLPPPPPPQRPERLAALSLAPPLPLPSPPPRPPVRDSNQPVTSEEMVTISGSMAAPTVNNLDNVRKRRREVAIRNELDRLREKQQNKESKN